MSEDFESERESQDSGLNPLGKWLLYAGAVILVVLVVVGIMHTGIDLGVGREGSTATDADAINLAKLREEAKTTPTPAPSSQTYGRTGVQLLEPQLTSMATATPQRTPDAMEEWRKQEALKAREAGPIVAAFEPKPNQVKEIPSGATSKLHPPASPWTITEGAVINSILQFGVNSDYPGDVVSQIERPLYDSATGHNLLIPAGSKLIGKFQRSVGPFQERIAITWHRLVLPNQWSMDIPDMPSTDDRGYAGVSDKVNNHYLSTFGSAALMSLLTAGSSIGSVLTFGGGNVSPYGGGVYQNNAMNQLGQTGVTNLGSQLGSTGDRFLQPRLNRSPTITIPPGYRFDVYVNTDLVLPGPYQDSAGATTLTAQR